jgi:hypothetical protein
MSADLVLWVTDPNAHNAWSIPALAGMVIAGSLGGVLYLRAAASSDAAKERRIERQRAQLRVGVARPTRRDP